ncbi:MAG: helix-turn-helix domain-containing protein [Candidatus Peregrinibacteria bacterium]|nr:helix-turn-helix domain-containing protein [Candidatus Peregrinibacteria bacterium]MDZ4244299.1 helix-turn-helix domain-containing protein [Candidatus Gracilibacteria bacterium]
MQNFPQLERIGMTNKEIKLYLKLLEFGDAGANTLARSTNENRTTTYSLLNSMIDKGFVSYYKKGSLKHFAPVNPSMLVAKFLDDANQLKRILPELLAVTNSLAHKPKITFHEGLDGIKHICGLILSKPGSVRYSFMGIDKDKMDPDVFEYYENDYINKRIEKGIKYIGIVAGEIPMGTEYEKTQEGQLRELKYIDKNLFPLDIHIDIFPDNRVALFSQNKGEIMGVVIEHESFYNTMKTVFKLAWAGVDALEKKS